jgi:hypothetical protein
MGLAEPFVQSFHGHVAGNGVLLGRAEGFGIDQDCLHVVKKVVAQPEQQHGGECRNDDADLVGQLQPFAAFPGFFREQDARGIPQVVLLGGIEIAVENHALLENRLPRRGERLAEQILAAALFQPAEEHSRNCITASAKR